MTVNELKQTEANAILFYSLVRPGLEFASVCFNSLTVTHEKRIEHIQNKCIGFLGNNVDGTEVIPLVSLKKRRQTLDLTFLF